MVQSTDRPGDQSQDQPSLRLLELPPKGREYHYPEAVFQSVARDWELPLIQQYEHLFADLRRRAQALAQLRLQVRRRLPKPVPERDDA